MLIYFHVPKKKEKKEKEENKLHNIKEANKTIQWDMKANYAFYAHYHSYLCMYI